MKKSVITIIIIVLAVIAIYAFFKNSYNSMVVKDETVAEKWSQVQNVYQRRADLIPNLVATVKGFAAQEQEVFIGVSEARANATSMNFNADNMNEANFKAFQEAQDQLSGALSRLLVTVERYPELKSDKNFLELQAQLEGTENRITVERKNFNEATNDYNKTIRVFPKNIIAGMFGFEKKPYFEAVQGADVAPKVEF